MSYFSPCITASGPRGAKMAFVGEAPGKEEEKVGLPFIGTAGQEFSQLLHEVGISRREIWLTNVLWTRPPDNNLALFTLKKRELGKDYPKLPAMAKGGYLHPDLLCEIDRLKDELESLRPNLIVALGGTASWALLGEAKISRCRGVASMSTLCPGIKVLPTYHPSAVNRNWEYRPIVLADLFKAKREAEFPEVRRPDRTLIIDPVGHEVIDFCIRAEKAPILVVDVETFKKTISTLGLAISPSDTISIPFLDRRKPGWSYWTEADEGMVRNRIEHLLSRHRRIVCQNGLYDVQYLWKEGIPLPGFRDDTMLLHHALFPELPKSLAFLGSIYTNETSWKNLAPRGKEKKKDE